MSGRTGTSKQPALGWRIKLGAALFVLSIVLPIVGVPAVAAIGLSTTITTSVSGMLLVVAEVLGVVAVAVMGKSGYTYIKSRVLGFLKQHGPPKEVSRRRYNIGLVMFVLPIFFGWVTPYAGDLIPGLEANLIIYGLCGDVLLLASLFVLGGNFWDKLRSLFTYDAEVHFSEASLRH